MKGQPLLTLNRISVRLYDALTLQNITWQIKADEQWAILGPNGSGKTTLAKVLFGGVPVVRGSVIHHAPASRKTRPFEGKPSIGYVSPELFRELFEREEMEAGFRDFSGKIHEITTAKDIILRGAPREFRSENGMEDRISRLAARTGIEQILERDVCGLSTGELCKVLIARALRDNPQFLILDEPFNGLDKPSRKALAKHLNALMGTGMNVILITHRLEEILPRTTHILYMENGEIRAAGNKEDVLQIAGRENGGGSCPSETVSVEKQSIPVSEERGSRTTETDSPDAQILIDMKEVTVRYGNTVVLDAFNWRVRHGENWAILGENGAGKSTVLKLVLGDNLQSYSNDVFVFGRKKGDGVSIWEIKKRIGLVSAEFQAKYRKDMCVFDVVCSGFHDSVGLYRACSQGQKETAAQWMKALGIEDLAGNSFARLSYGRRKLALIARAMVKSPALLFLDEPCDGLDGSNRKKILGILEYIGRHTHTNLVYVTHHENEMLPCITHSLTLCRGKIIEKRGLLS